MNTWKKAVKEYYRFHKMGRNDFTYRKYFEPIFEGKDIKEITIVKKDISNLGLIEENKETESEPIEKYNEKEKEKEMKEKIKVEKNTDETETVDNFIDDIANLMENKGIDVDKETKTYTLFDDAEENE